jgi:hypothetical protein
MAHADFPAPTPDTLAAWVRDARRRTLALVADLTDQQLLGPCWEPIRP